MLDIMLRDPSALIPTFQRLTDQMDRLLSASGRPGFVRPPNAFPMNVWHDDDDLFLEAELPGVKLEDLEIAVDGEKLVLRGKRMLARPENAEALSIERRPLEFERFLALPFEVEAEKAEAVLRDGVLTLRLPKAPTARPRRIEIRGVKAIEGRKPVKA